MLTRVGRRKFRGAALVEGALVMLATLAMTVFIIDLGRLMLMYSFISERTRATARAAAVNNWTSTQAKNYLVYGDPSTQTMTAPGRLGLLPSQVTYLKLGTPGAADYRLQVQVSGVKAFLATPYLAHSYKLPTIMATFPAESLGATQ